MEKQGKKTELRSERGSRIKRGSVSAVYTVVFVALVIALNLVVSSVAGAFSLNIDLTAEEFISIGEVSRNVLGDLESDGDLDATIYLLADRDTYDNVSDTDRARMRGLNPAALVRDLCEEYARTYDGVRVEYRNLQRDPEWAAEYNKRANTTLTQNNIVVEGKYHARVLTLDSFYTVDSGSGTYVGFNGELRITTALLQSCMSEPQVVTFTTGHGEPAQLGATGPTSLAKLLQDNGFEIREADLSSDDIDERTRILIVDDPQTDFTEAEVDKLMDYMGEYHSMIVLVDDSTPELKNLQDYLEHEWGINYNPYHQVSSVGGCLNNDPLNLSAQYVSDVETPDSSASYQLMKNVLSVRTVMPHCVELVTAATTTKDDYTVETVLLSADDGRSTFEGTSNEGTFPLMLLSSNSDYVDLNDENSTNQVREFQYVLLSGSTDFAGTGVIDSAAYGNSTLLLSAVRTMGVDRYSLDIDYKSINDVALGIETSSAFRLGIIICAVLPAAITIAGLVVFIRRRHL